MISKRIIFSLIILVLTISVARFVTAQTIVPVNFTFQNNLKLGSTLNPDVRYLQSFLNQNSATRVANIGPGSDTELTNYFGSKTFDAVSRFQNLYASEILIPNGLTAPTGFFGPSSRAKANSLIQQTQSTAITPIVTPQANPTPSPTLAQVYPPQIIVVVPNATANANQIINIHGYGFSPTDNAILSNAGVILHLPSTNNTISFKISDFTGYQNTIKAMVPGKTIDILFRIKNSNGVSEEIGGVVFGTGPANLYQFANPYEEEDTSTTTNSTSSGVTSTATDSQGIVQQAASMDLGLQGIIQVINQVSGINPAAEQLSGLDPVYSLLGGSGSSGGAGGFGGSGGSGGSGGGGQVDNFGGRVTNVTYCTCSAGELFTVQDIRGQSKNLFYGYVTSTLHEEYNLSSGVNVVGGSRSSSTECSVYNGESCDTQGTAEADVDFLRGVGTSLM